MTTIWYSLMRLGALFCSHSAFYKYANLVDERKPIKKKIAPVKSIKATRIFEYIHIDTTFIDTLKDGKVRVVAIKDNFSKAILHCAVVKDGSSKWIALLMQELFSMHNLFDYKNSITLVSDGGSENKGEVDTWIAEIDRQEMFVHKTARTPSFVFTNNEIESVFNIFKNEFLLGKDVLDTATAIKLLEAFMLYNNNERYPISLYGLTPQEVFNGELIDKYRFKNSIKQAQKDRVAANKNKNNCKTCF